MCLMNKSCKIALESTQRMQTCAEPKNSYIWKKNIFKFMYARQMSYLTASQSVVPERCHNATNEICDFVRIVAVHL